MNILNISTWDNEYFGFYLHQHLKANGYNSRLAVFYKNSNDVDTYLIGNFITRRFDKRIVSFFERLFGINSIFPISGLTLMWKKYFMKSDIVHLHVIYGVSFFSILFLPFISRIKKVVWTIHDSWIMTGHCVYPINCERWKTGCGNCPNLTLPICILWDSTAIVWRLKRVLLKYSNVTLIASPWLREQIKQSPILSHFPCYTMIYGLNMTRFKIKDKKQCRDLFNIPMDAHVIAFRFMGENDKLKGWVYIKEALGAMTLTKPTYIITTQMKGISKFLDKKFTCIELGFVPDSEMIVDVMNAADLFLMPSEAESYGMMAIESMACGTPVIVFEGTSLADIIHAPNGGIAVPKSPDALMHAIEDLLNDHNKYDTIVKNGLDIVKNEYDAEKCVKVNVDVYKTLIDRST